MTFGDFKFSRQEALLIGGLLVMALVVELSTSPAVPASEAGKGNLLLPASRVVGSGRVEPASREINLAAEIPGIVAKIHAREGELVKKGQIVAELIQSDLIAKIVEAERVLSIKSADYQKRLNGSRPEEKRQAAAQLEEIDQSVKLLQTRLQRQMKVYKSGFLTPDAMDEARSGVAVALAKQKAAAASYSLMKMGARSEDIAAARADVDLAKAQLDTARAQLEKARVRATVDGTVLQVFREVGEAASIQPAAPVMQIGDLTKLVIRVQIDQSDIEGLRKGQRAEVRTSSYPGRIFRGVLTEISPRIGAKTIYTGAPAEKTDTSVIEGIIALDEGASLPIGLRVDAYIEKSKP